MTGSSIQPLVAIALLSLALPATAAPGSSTAAVKVDISGIDLATSAGRVQLERRVARTIDAICGPREFFMRDETDALAACRDATRADVEPQVRAVVTRASLAAP